MPYCPQTDTKQFWYSIDTDIMKVERIRAYKYLVRLYMDGIEEWSERVNYIWSSLV